MKKTLSLFLALSLFSSTAFATSVTTTGAGKPSAGGGGGTPAYVNGNTNQNGASSVTTASVTKSAVGSGNAVIVTYCGTFGPLTVVTFTDNQSNTYTNWSGTVNNTAGGFSCAQAWAANITNAPTSFTGTSTVAGTFIAVSVDEFTNILAVLPMDGGVSNTQNNPGTGANAVTSGNLTSLFNGDLIYGFLVSIGSRGFTNGTGFTARQSVTSTFYSQSLIQGSAGSIACTATDANAADDTIAFCLALRHN